MSQWDISAATCTSHVSLHDQGLVFLVSLFPYAQFPCAAASADVLVWHCIEHLEMIGLKVLALVCDGASSNRKLYKMHRDGTKSLPTKSRTYMQKKTGPYFLCQMSHIL